MNGPALLGHCQCCRAAASDALRSTSLSGTARSVSNTAVQNTQPLAMRIPSEAAVACAAANAGVSNTRHTREDLWGCKLRLQEPAAVTSPRELEAQAEATPEAAIPSIAVIRLQKPPPPHRALPSATWVAARLLLQEPAAVTSPRELEAQAEATPEEAMPSEAPPPRTPAAGEAPEPAASEASQPAGALSLALPHAWSFPSLLCWSC